VLIGVDGEQLVLRRRDLTLVPTESGRASAGDVDYPMAWQLLIPARDLELEIEPLFGDSPAASAAMSVTQEASTWRGAVEVKGWRGADAIGGTGRMDLSGYAERGRVGT
jgi:predicted secreted hydrolase